MVLSMKERVVFLHYHGIGHINPCLPLANMLREKRYDVFFSGVEHFRLYVTHQHFPFYGLKSVPFGLGFETWTNTIGKKKSVYFSTLLDRITDRLYTQRETELIKMLDELRPNIVLLDANQATDFIILYPHLLARGIKMAILHNMLPAAIIPGRPPINSYAIPGDKKSEQAAMRTWRKQNLVKKWRKKLTYFFFDDQFIINRRLKKNRIPIRFISRVPSLFNFTVNGVTELVFAPREFDFPDFAPGPNQHYIGFIASMQRDFGSEKFREVRAAILSQKTTKGSKLIYCSFGTTDPDDKTVIPAFVAKLIRVSCRLKHVLVLSVRDEKMLKEIQQYPGEGIYTFQSLPQVELLNDADLFITHGGLSSIKEAIDAEVPMLVYPVHATYDPKGNAARVVFHGMGLRGDPAKDSEHEIQTKINRLLSGTEFRDHVVKMKELNRRNDPGRFISILEQLKPFSSP